MLVIVMKIDYIAYPPFFVLILVGWGHPKIKESGKYKCEIMG